MRAAVALLFVAGCYYKPGSFSFVPFHYEGVTATTGCLDVGVERKDDYDGRAVVTYAFANRCDRPALVDLGGVAVVGRTAAGDEVSLAPFDPDGEIRPLPLDGRLYSQETLAYGDDVAIEQICIDIASIGRQTPANWHCFARAEGL